MAAQNREFILVGKFQDGITPSLKKINSQLAATTKSFQKMQKVLRPIAKDMAIMGASAKMLAQGFKDQKLGIDTSVRALTQYRKEMGKAAAAAKKFKQPKFQSYGPDYGGPTRRRTSRAGSRAVEAFDDGFTIEKGVVAGIATTAITRVFDMIVNATGNSINYLKGAIRERVEDEMSDIKSAGGIFSIGKDKKMPFADTYQEAVTIQKNLNAEMANLAAALPGTTNDYVRNMKQVTDTAMKAVANDSKGMIAELNSLGDLGIKSVKTAQEAFTETTKQLAKYSTLAEQGATGGTPFTMLMEQIIGAEKVSISSMKRRYVQLRDPLLSGALQDFEAEMNKFGAGSPKRIAAMFKALNKAFPPEVIAAMEKSADGIYQAMRSYLFDPDIGWFGLGRIIKMDFSAFKGNKMGKLEESMSLFDMFVKMFGAFGQVLGPILAELPKILEVFDPLIQPMKEFYVNAENTISNLNAAKKEFGKLKVSFPMFRASLKAIGQLAKSFGGNQKEVDKLNKMLYDPKMNLGAALQQAMKTLFSSEAMERFGKAFGQALGGFLSMLAGLAEKGKGIVDESGLMKGFAEGWRASKGSEAIAKLVKDLIGFIIKSVVGLIFEAARTDPIGVATVATVFIAPVRSAVIKLLQTLAGVITRGLAPKAMGRMGVGKYLMARGMRGAAKAGGIAADLPGMGKAIAVTKGAKMKGIGIVAAGIVKLATVSPQLQKAGTALLKVGKAIPGVSVAIAGLDFAAKKATGADTATAAGGALGGLVGGGVGAAIGTAIAPGIGTAIGGVLGTVIGDWIGSNLPRFFAGLPSKLSQAFESFKMWFLNLPMNLGILYGQVQANLEAAWMRFKVWWNNLGPSFQQILDGAIKAIQQGWNKFTTTLNQIFSGEFDWGGLAKTLAGTIWKIIKAGIEGVAGFIGGAKDMMRGAREDFKIGADVGYHDQRKKIGKASNMSPIFARYAGGLGDAISSEMRNKPSGSSLVIANSSETVIPAAGGLGMGALINAIRQSAAISAQSVKQMGQQTQTAIAKMAATQQSGLQQVVAAVKMAAAAGGGAGGSFFGGGGGGKGSIIGAGKMLLGMGLQVGMNPNFQYGKGFLPGGGGYIGKHSPNSLHYSGRAVDVSGPPALLDQAYARLKGTNPTELLWRTAGHYDHLHVAYALGAGMPAFFGSQSAAQDWERKMTPGSVKVRSVTGNSKEGFGSSNVTINAPITINQQPGQDAEQLASIVALKLGEAINQARSASIFV